MIRLRPSGLTAAALLVALGACSTDGPTALNERGVDARTAAAPFDEGVDDGNDTLTLCKISFDTFYPQFGMPVYDRLFDFEVSAASGTWDSGLSLQMGKVTSLLDWGDWCEVIWEGNAEGGVEVEVTEIYDEYAQLLSVAAWIDYVDFYQNGTDLIWQPGDLSATLTVQPGSSRIWFKNRTFEEPEIPSAEGRMTGGGVKAVGIDADGNEVPVTLGLTLHCDNTLSNNLQVNWPHKNTWHIKKESLTEVECSLRGDPSPPVAPITTFKASAEGRLNGDPGASVYFVFEDYGEPGRDDTISMKIYDPDGNLVLTVDHQTLPIGNFQMHYDQPHGQKPEN